MLQAGASEADSIAASWLAKLSSALQAEDTRAFAATFLPNGWFRDVLTFVWDTRSIRGPDAIASYLSESNRLAKAKVTNVALDKDPYFVPHFVHGPGGSRAVEVGFRYETEHTTGRAYAHLEGDDKGLWNALTLAMIIVDIKGHEEPQDITTNWDAGGRTWMELEEDRRAQIESNPYVLIVGGGQCGLSVAARCRQMGIPALVIDKTERIGDTWRNRYSSLALHTPKTHHTMLYQPFPSNWPLYTPRDKVASWLEGYATNQHLICWMGSTLGGQPRYDPVTRVWDVVVDRNGTHVHLRPAHIVLAIGLNGPPRMPSLPNRSQFPGEVLHSADFMDAKPFVGKRVVVVGSGNSSIDVCQDLVTGGAASVTMVQRSTTCVVSRSSVTEDMHTHAWIPGQPIEVGDFKFSSQPLGWLKEVNMSMQDALWEREKTLHDKLRKGGLKLNMGPEGQGQFLMVFERGGGYWLDKGGADLIETGAIRIKQGATPTGFSPTGLLFSDGTSLATDTVIFATGYQPMREAMKQTFGEDVINSTCDTWGLDNEGEIRGCFRPTGHPGLWYAIGDFFNCRFMSKQLAILIKASQLGLYKAEIQRTSPTPLAKL